MKLRRHAGKLSCALAIGATVLQPCAGASGDKIFETNVTGDLNISSGEPEIAVDPKNPRNLAIVEFGAGSDKRPANSYNPLDADALTKDLEGATANTGRVMLSKDGGNHWWPHAPPAYDPNASPHPGGGDPFIAYGPDGTLYVGGETGPAPKPGAPIDISTTNIFVAPSRDGGKTFAPAQSAGTPEDRPWITVDQTTGTVYTASTGTIDANTKVHNVPPGPDVTNDRWLVTWQPHLAGKSAPQRIGGPDFSGAGGSTITAAHGVIAATFVLGGPTPGAGSTGGPPAPTPVPASLQNIVQGGVTSCSMQAPCLFFETSSDQGRHWTRHHIPVAGGFSGQRANVAADPEKPGRYAIAVLTPTRTNFLVLVTDDSGATWSGPVTIPETAAGADFKQWMAYGPTGALGLVWKKRRDDLTPPSASGQPRQGAIETAFDVYAAISCDGGTTWASPLRVNGETSPAGTLAFDDLAYIALDANNAHVVWGDRRTSPKVTNVTGAFGGTQAYYGRLPFSLVSKGVKCGRG
jgi:hypothetical protein